MKQIEITATEKEVICKTLTKCVEAITIVLDARCADNDELGYEEMLEMCELTHERGVMLSIINKFILS